jgi:predicted flap endonuclease-1-like 5' DNA nuclease
MSKDNDGISCAINCCKMGAIVGLVGAVLFYVIGGYTVLPALFVGIVIGVIVAVIIGIFTCGKSNSSSLGAHTLGRAASNDGGTSATSASPNSTSSNSAEVSVAPSTPADSNSDEAVGETTASVETDESAALPASSSPVKAFEMQPSAPLAGQAELAARKGDWKYEAEPVAKDAPAATEKPAVVEAEVVEKAAAKKAPAKKAAATKKAKAADAKPKAVVVVTDGEPETLSGPRAGTTADDLKLISGVGPKLEQTLNELGFYHFDQVAKWREAEIAWVDSRLRFKGRIERDDWMSQAKTLAEGGETEFSARKKK